MFARLRAARENLRRMFAAQFDEYQGRRVYRKLMRGQPIAVTEIEHAQFIADFEKFIPRFMWIVGGSMVAIIFGVVAVDESGLLPMPNWVPMLAIIVSLPWGMIAYRRALTAPSRALQMRAPMGGERSNEDFAVTALRAMPWHNFIPSLAIGAAVLGIIGYAYVANRVIFSREPVWTGLATIFGAWLFFGTLVTLFRKWRAEQAPRDGNQNHFLR